MLFQYVEYRNNGKYFRKSSRNNAMLTSQQMEPMIPSKREDLNALALEAYKASAKLAGRVHAVTARRLTLLLRNVNSYYSNLIEGVRTSLLDIESGLKQISDQEKTRRLQKLQRQNIVAQAEVEQECPEDGKGITASAFLCRLHHLLFHGLPEEFLVQRDTRGERTVIMEPGKIRTENVRIGDHVPPPHEELDALLDRFQQAYSLERFSGAERLTAAAASHHRLLWIHPFLEGNGRVARLFTDTYFRCAGLEGYGLWTISRGLSRREAEYKSLLASADNERRNDYDGRGALSEKGLHAFCLFFLQTALDQARFMDQLLDLDAAEKNIHLYCALRSQGNLPGAPPLPKESGRILAHVFIRGSLVKGDVASIAGVSDRKAFDITKTLLHEGLLEAEHQKAPLTIGLPARAVEFILPGLCDPGAFR